MPEMAENERKILNVPETGVKHLEKETRPKGYDASWSFLLLSVRFFEILKKFIQ